MPFGDAPLGQQLRCRFGFFGQAVLKWKSRA
jgi:hypothetical protein